MQMEIVNTSSRNPVVILNLTSPTPDAKSVVALLKSQRRTINMPAIPKKKTSQTVWVAKWEHKHGDDIAIHATEESARKQLVAWTRTALEDFDDWEGRYAALSDDALIEAWPDITGETEFLYVEDHILHSADVWDEVAKETIKSVDVFETPN
jgi:hypothetical protein